MTTLTPPSPSPSHRWRHRLLFLFFLFLFAGITILAADFIIATQLPCNSHWLYNCRYPSSSGHSQASLTTTQNRLTYRQLVDSVMTDLDAGAVEGILSVPIAQDLDADGNGAPDQPVVWEVMPFSSSKNDLSREMDASTLGPRARKRASRSSDGADRFGVSEVADMFVDEGPKDAGKYVEESIPCSQRDGDRDPDWIRFMERFGTGHQPFFRRHCPTFLRICHDAAKVQEAGDENLLTDGVYTQGGKGDLKGTRWWFDCRDIMFVRFREE